jgi:HEAT repeat protein/DNA-directed RNA polymerase subunit RPC12/RpoP
MAIAVACPHCKQANKLDDAQKGKEARCVHCRKGFLVKVKSAAEGAAAEPASKQQIKAGAPKPPPVRAVDELRRGSRAAADEVDEVDEPARRRRDRDDDRASDRDRGRDRDDDRPSRRRPPSNAGVIVALIMGGILLLGGGAFALFWFVSQEGEPQAQNPGAPGAPAEDPLKGIRLQDVVIDPTRPEDFDIMIKLLASEEEALRKRAHEWLARAKVGDHPRRGEVAKLLESRVQLYIDRPFNEHFFDAYFAWATKDNFNWLINMVREKGFGTHRRRALETLAKLKDERAIPEMVNLLDSFHDRDVAFRALAEIGSAAEKNVIGNLHHPDNGARDQARKLLQLYNTPQEKLLNQTLADLNGIEEARITHAMEWLAKAPVDEKRRSEVAKAIDRHLPGNQRGFRNTHVWTAVGRWGTADNVVRLTQALQGERLGAPEIIKALGNIKEPRAAQALAGRIGNFFDGNDAQLALQNMGELAEPAVIPHLLNPDAKQRVNAARMLAIVGTNASLQPLTNAARAFPKDRDFFTEAGNAFQAIKARGK